MSQNTDELQVVPGIGVDSTSLSHPVQTLARFLRIVLLRRDILIITVIAALLLSLLYYATATRIYRAEASLLVLQTGQQDVAASMAGERVARDLMPTYTSIATSEAVLIEALKLLAPEDRNVFAGVPPSDWTNVLRD